MVNEIYANACHQPMSWGYLTLIAFTALAYSHAMIRGYRTGSHRSVWVPLLLLAFGGMVAGTVYVGIGPAWQGRSSHALGTVLCLAAVSLFLLSHRQHCEVKPCIAFASEEPAAFVTSGPYRFIRHPIYSAYLLSVIGFGVYSGHPFFVFAFALLFALYSDAAAREVRDFLRSTFADRYRVYLRQTGRFLPELHATPPNKLP